MDKFDYLFLKISSTILNVNCLQFDARRISDFVMCMKFSLQKQKVHPSTIFSHREMLFAATLVKLHLRLPF